ncbi:MAG: type II toxin-antitoxin system RelB/DinJ family antitoxin [Peptococcaceae bacterium]|nr:type II toxin-antitoxin system RelB/DinJ family antitoxin [Peptococcaceae bacterium]
MARTTTNMNIRMDKEVKEQAQQIFAQLGMDMTTAVNVFLRQTIRYNGFPFELRLDIPNAETMAAIQEVQQMKQDPSLGKSYTDVEEMMKELLK